MRYATNQDLPFVCQVNLPEAAQQLWRESFNEAWKRGVDAKARHAEAQAHAFAELRRYFEKDSATGRWMQKAVEARPRRTRMRRSVPAVVAAALIPAI